MDDLIVQLNRFSSFAFLLPLAIGLLRARKLDVPQQMLWTMIEIVCITELGANLLSTIWGNNLPLYHVYVAVEFFMLSFIFQKGYKGLLSRSKHQLIVDLFLLLAMLNILFKQSLNTYASYSRTLESLTLIAIAISFFYLVLKELRLPNLERSFMFWFASAVLLYFSANLLLFIYSNFIMLETQQTFLEVWAIHGFLNILLYILYTIALLCPSQPQSLKYS